MGLGNIPNSLLIQTLDLSQDLPEPFLILGFGSVQDRTGFWNRELDKSRGSFPFVPKNVLSVKNTSFNLVFY